MITHIAPSATFGDWLVDGVPITDDGKVVPASAAVPESQQRFLGAWVGRWGGGLQHILIVESLQPDGSASVRPALRLDLDQLDREQFHHSV